MFTCVHYSFPIFDCLCFLCLLALVILCQLSIGYVFIISSERIEGTHLGRVIFFRVLNQVVRAWITFSVQFIFFCSKANSAIEQQNCKFFYLLIQFSQIELIFVKKIVKHSRLSL